MGASKTGVDGVLDLRVLITQTESGFEAEGLETDLSVTADLLSEVIGLFHATVLLRIGEWPTNGVGIGGNTRWLRLCELYLTRKLSSAAPGAFNLEPPFPFKQDRWLLVNQE